ncbi:hypothetical protein QTI66_31965 [Variovorax sp. J22R133]|uniref:hypothetical protein n=1 Tax=Variovorax brevis TaxID=3053503 RepID=UPI0025766D9E|nr:hypothetical protein [Variovorax sp. J22R133]MDM0116753.1 hypothetical protein [Variovorax sp. J22R133]
MSWDFSTHSPLTVARLRFASCDVVAQALDEYGTFFTTNRPGLIGGHEELEQALAARQDRLINLALAKNACSGKLLEDLYAKGKAGSDDTEYDKALRLSVIANTAASEASYFGKLAGLDAREARRLALEGDDDEISTLMRNPGRRALLGDVYLRTPPFEDIPYDRLLRLVHYSATNPNLSLDNDSMDGPDMIRMDVQKGVFELAATTPLNSEWIHVMHQLLVAVNPFRFYAYAEEQRVRDLLNRLKSVRVTRMFSKEGEDQEGIYTDLTFVEEYRCIIGALFGKVYENGKQHFIGPVDDPDLAIRCSHYAHGNMDPKQMLAAKARERQPHDLGCPRFAFAALFNASVLSKKDSREELEGMLVGHQFALYRARCQFMQAIYPSFDPTPLTDSFDDLDRKTGPADASAVELLAKDLANLRTEFRQFAKFCAWTLFVIIAGLVSRPL